MANIKLIIDIDEEDFEIMKHNIAVDNPLCPISQKDMVIKIANGTPLPKGHGRLIDADYLDMRAISIVLKEDVDNAPTIIEADKAESEDNKE